MLSRLVPRQPLGRCSSCRKFSLDGMRNAAVAEKGADGGGSVAASEEVRRNHFGIQMLPDELRKPIFGQRAGGAGIANRVAVLSAREELVESFNLSATSETLAYPDFEMPELLGANVAEHFMEIGRQQCQPYLQYSDDLMAVQSLPPMPAEWQFTAGWCRYTADCPGGEPVPFPDEKVLVFDVEVWMEAAGLPVLAVAASPTAWYAWTSEVLAKDVKLPQFLGTDRKWLIPVAGPLDAPPGHDWSERLIVGHNVSFDRAYVQEEYLLKGPKTRFLDTLSLHVISGGLNNMQKILLKSHRKAVVNRQKERADDLMTSLFSEESAAPPTHGLVDKDRLAFEAMADVLPDDAEDTPDSKWMTVGCTNGLKDLYRFYCKKKMDKSTVEMFITSKNLSEIRERFQEGMTYCAMDVQATFEVYQEVYSRMLDHAAHPCSMAGMLQMGSCYLPVDTSWSRYVKRSEQTYQELLGVMKRNLMTVADTACQKAEDGSEIPRTTKTDMPDHLKADPWLYSLDWSRFPSPALPRVYIRELVKWLDQSESDDSKSADRGMPSLTPRTEQIVSAAHRKAAKTSEIAKFGSPDEKATAALVSRATFVPPSVAEYRMRLTIPHMANYPMWYRQLCPVIPQGGRHEPSYLTAAKRISPLLLRLTWEGYPLHHIKDSGWGYLVPAAKWLDEMTADGYQMFWQYNKHGEPIDRRRSYFPQDMAGDLIGDFSPEFLREAGAKFAAFVRSCTTSLHEEQRHGDDVSSESGRGDGGDAGSQLGSPACTINHPVYGPLNFIRLPHKDGPHKNVGSPLSKSFFTKMDDGTLRSVDGSGGAELLRLNSMIAYWRSSRARISKQLVFFLKNDHLPTAVKSDAQYSYMESYGAILPRLIACGTITRRAVEPCWMTVSNAEVNRVGSELKSMIRSPPGYHFVGADVDSEELWISGVLADSHLAREHGCTPIGWMNLQGNKADGTDMHSRTASTIGISRNAAKTFNYARIYGAGKKHATSLLLQFNHHLSQEEAERRAAILYESTKGVRRAKLTARGIRLAKSLDLPVESGNYMSTKHLVDLWRQETEKEGDGEADVVDSEVMYNELSDKKIAARSQYSGGTESHLFNRLQRMIEKPRPTTPALGVIAPKPILKENIQREFVPCRINWIVQSSGVDYLHALLVCMKWLMDKYDIDGRLSLSIHDEVRFLVVDEDRHRAALALHISNLLVRSLFSYQLGMYDLPQSVAFFSQVDIDSCIRKEVDMDCVTPSNPYGMRRGHRVEFGEGVDIHATIERTGGTLRKPAAGDTAQQREAMRM